MPVDRLVYNFINLSEGSAPYNVVTLNFGSFEKHCCRCGVIFKIILTTVFLVWFCGENIHDVLYAMCGFQVQQLSTVVVFCNVRAPYLAR